MSKQDGMNYHNVPDGSIVAFRARFSFRHLFRKPFHYLIQIFTGSRYHHIGIMSDDFLYESLSSTGVVYGTLSKRYSKLSKYESFDIYEPQFKLTKEQKQLLKEDLQEQLGKKYSRLQAFLSIFTALLFWNRDKIKTKKMFCSKLVVYAVMKRFPKKIGKVLPRDFNPEEAIKILRTANYI
jgi:hypothetical protein